MGDIMQNYDLVIVDSGVNIAHPAIKDCNINGLCFNFISDEEFTINTNIDDDIGHGTAVYYLISRYLENESVLNVKVFAEGFEPNTAQIIEVLNYIKNNISCKMIHLSNGIVFCDEKKRLQDVCRSLTQNGVIIVCAFENTGIISCPAAFNEVIGVDWSLSCRRTNEFEFVENSCLNIRGIGTAQRVPWTGDTYSYVSGSSFAAPHVTGEILKQHISNKLAFNKADILLHFQSIAKRAFPCKPTQRAGNSSFAIKKAIMFPFNKEMHSLARFNKLLNFEVANYYDVGCLGNVGKSVGNILSGTKNLSDKMILNYDQIEWESNFDTVILGHTKDISSIIGRDLIKEVLDNCIKYKKNLYCFDDLAFYDAECSQIRKIGCYIYYPYIGSENVPVNRFGKLHSIGKPLLMVMGTSSKQGKFTLQLTLREMFLKNGYRVGQLGTEPSSLLFGMDEVYPMGFGSTVKIQNTEAISVINQLLHNIEEKDPDIVLLGAQSHTLQLNTGNTGFYPLMNYELLLASDPDAIILCVNYQDSIDYIKRCILFLENFIDTKVISIVLFPMEKNYKWNVLGVNSRIVSKDKLEAYRGDLKQNFKLPVFQLDDEKHMQELFNDVIDYFI